MRAAVVSRHGPEVIDITDIERPTPGPMQILVELGVADVNYMDVYQRSGAVPKDPPLALSGGSGAYAGFVIVEAARAVPVPDNTTTAVLMRGIITARHLACDA